MQKARRLSLRWGCLREVGEGRRVFEEFPLDFETWPVRAVGYQRLPHEVDRQYDQKAYMCTFDPPAA
jgi:hypothetical protein